MTESFFEPYMGVAYPCYWLEREHGLLMNAAAMDAGPPLADKAAMEKTLRTAMQEQSGKTAPFTLPLPADAMGARALMLVPMEGGLLAFAAQRAQAPVDAFSGMVRSALTNIFATLPMLASRLDDPDMHLAEGIRNNCYTLLRMAGNIEVADRIERGKMAKNQLDLRLLVKSLCHDADYVCKGTDIPIDLDLPELPVPVCGDAAMLGDAILNLLRNSLQYTRDGNHVLVTLKEVRGRAILTVRDWGLGIRAEHLDRIFEPYFSADPYGDGGERPGLGLGLAVVRETVRASGGTVTAESTFGEGTAITLALPVDEGETETLGSQSTDYLLNRFSPVYIQLSGYCQFPGMQSL